MKKLKGTKENVRADQAVTKGSSPIQSVALQ